MIKSLKLKGFKSFADETEIRFTDGINCIVGPNGCGKSNIVDALKWVVGVTSAKGMRADSIKDVVFKGAEGRRPARSAEVSVVVASEDLTFPETEITRRVKADGESEFLINGRKVRLKDIQEVFLKLGLSNRDYAFFEQGQIEKVLRMKPVERRALIDEAAGITPFKVKREETLRQLEEAQQNLENTRSVIDEVAKNLRALKNQAEKAKRFKELRSKERELELKLLGYQLKKVQEEKAKLEGSIRVLQEDRASLEREVSLLTVEIEELRSELDRLNREVEDTAKELAEVEKSKKEASVKREFLTKEIERLKGEIEEREKEKEFKLKRLSALASEIEELKGKERELLKSLSELEKEEKAVKERISEIRKKRGEFEERELSLSRKISGVDAQINKLQMDLAREEERFKSQRNLLERIPAEISQFEKEKDYYASQVERVEREIEKIKGEIGKLEGELSLKREELSEARERLEEAEAELEEKRREALRVKTEIENTERILSSINLKKVEQKIVESGQKGKVKGYIGLLLNLIEVEPGWEKVVENYLSTFGAGIVLKTPEDVVWVKEKLKGKGRVNLLFVGVTEVPETPEIEGALPVVKFVKPRDSRVGNLIKAIFHKVYYAPEGAPSLAARYPDAVFIDGDFNLFSAKGCVVGKFKESSLLELEREVRRKREELSEIESEIEELKEKLTPYREDVEALEERVEEVREEIQKKKMALFEAESKLKELKRKLSEVERRKEELLDREKRARESVDSFERRSGILKNKIEELKKEKEELLSKLAGLKREKEELEKLYEEVKEELSKVSSERSVLLEKLSSLREKIRAKEGALKSLRREVEESERRVEKAQKELERAKSELKRAEEILSGVDETIEDITEELKNLEEKRKELSSLIKNKEEALKQRNAHLSEVSKKLKSSEIELAKLTVQEEELLKKIVDAEGSVSEALQLAESVEDEEELKRELINLKERISRLGAVNMLAIEEYEKIKERYGFILEQERDLIESIKNLKEAIKRLDEEIEKRFYETFKAVNREFRRSVKAVFGGGTGKLILTSENLSEAGLEIEVKPPGKRHSNLNLLSGGERTLVALTFLYALYSVRPAPFIVLDEVDAALDDANTVRLTELLKQMALNTQVIIITHNKLTMEVADAIFGVTMETPGVSKVIGVSFEAVAV